MDTPAPREPLLMGLKSYSEESEQNFTPSSTNQNAVNPSDGSSAQSPCCLPGNYFKSAQWSPDGTTILTSIADNTLRSFILPPDLLSPPHPHTLDPYSTHTCPEPAYSTAFHPSYTLSDPSTCLILASLRSLPIRLISPFAPSAILASYPLISPTTEAYITPHSLLFNPVEPNHFFAGSDSCIDIFDINRNGEGPVTQLRTTPSRRHHKASTQGMKGIISALTMSNDGVLAAGTFTRSVGLYDSHGHGDTTGVFSLNNTPISPEKEGEGITQLLWSPCSRYLCIAERCSDGISVWDIRGTGTRLAWLKGRKAETYQRLSVDLMGGEIWAGGMDGMVRVWEGLGMKEGVVEPSWSFQAHGDVVSSAVLHPTGSVLATSSGQRHWGPDDFENDSTASLSPSSSESSVSSLGTAGQSKTSDYSLKVWAI